MHDALVKRLRTAAKWSDKGLVIMPSVFLETAEVIEMLADAYEAEVTTHRWIPVTEKLPEFGASVLCYCRANIYAVMKMRTDGNWVYCTDYIYMHSFVTHWMPLPPSPDPPKEETC